MDIYEYKYHKYKDKYLNLYRHIYGGTFKSSNGPVRATFRNIVPGPGPGPGPGRRIGIETGPGAINTKQASIVKEYELAIKEEINEVSAARRARVKTLFAQPLEKKQKCPNCNIKTNCFKLSDNNINICNKCTEIKPIMIISKCDHIYCEECYTKYSISSEISENPEIHLNKDKPCMEQNTVEIICPVCSISKVKIIKLGNLIKKCPICKDQKIMIFTCCGHFLCYDCAINHKI